MTDGRKRMLFMRCMSWAEMRDYLNGLTLRNVNTHPASRSTSIGFCFFPAGERSDTVEMRLRYLAGIACLDVVGIFEPVGDTWLTKAEGYYRRFPDRPVRGEIQIEELYGAEKKTEFCTTVYDKTTLRLLEAGVPYWTGPNTGWKVKWLTGVQKAYKNGAGRKDARKKGAGKK